MIYFAYPAIFYTEDDVTNVIFPDLNISTDGKDLTEAFLFAKDLLRVYFTYATKHDLDYNLPSLPEELLKKSNSGETVMMVDTFVERKKDDI